VVRDPCVIRTYQVIVDKLFHQSRAPQILLISGPLSRELVSTLQMPGIPSIDLKPWGKKGALADWRVKLGQLKQMSYEREIDPPTFHFDGKRRQIPRCDLPFGTPRWVGTSGDRGSQPLDLSTGQRSFDYYKLYVPRWVHRLKPGSV
jgi:hypothetical protein